MKALTTFNIETNIFKGEKAINAICSLGGEQLTKEQRIKLQEIDTFLQDVWKQMTAQQFPNGINSKTTVEK